jgi:hypothetical protein
MRDDSVRGKEDTGEGETNWNLPMPMGSGNHQAWRQREIPLGAVTTEGNSFALVGGTMLNRFRTFTVVCGPCGFREQVTFAAVIGNKVAKRAVIVIRGPHNNYTINHYPCPSCGVQMDTGEITIHDVPDRVVMPMGEMPA